MAVRRMTRSLMPAGPSPSSARTRRRGLLPWTPDIEQGGAWVWHLSRATHHQPTAPPLWPQHDLPDAHQQNWRFCTGKPPEVSAAVDSS